MAATILPGLNTIAVLGAGPAGLYAATLLKRRHPQCHVDVFEQNAADATFGFGVVFSDQAMGFLRQDDPETAAAIAPHMQGWQNITLDLDGARIEIDGIGFSAIGRLALLQILQARALAAGVTLHFNHAITEPGQLAGHDLVIAADGINSLARRSHAEAFGTTLQEGTNKFIWYGTDLPFDTLSQTFVTTATGAFTAHHYRYGARLSTFIIECQAETWAAHGFAGKSEAQTRAACAEIFATALQGHDLISNRSVWRQFPFLANRHWSHRNIVLIGDALHSAHFSIGSGTRLAMEDALALVKALECTPGDLAAALQAYEAARRPAVEKLTAAARASAIWYEDFATHMHLPPLDFAMSYITRSGRVDLARLRALSPRFMARYDASATQRS
ncbi:MAG: FAD-dependent monooxygenase [Hyphomicrobiales bacterium]|nr:FAD-dependent monooxygenase [Hyphomicrobiales bacterium]